MNGLSDPALYGQQAKEGLGVAVPDGAKRVALQVVFPSRAVFHDDRVAERRSAIDTVEHFQGGERTVMVVSTTESDRAYLLAASDFLLGPRRRSMLCSFAMLTQALSVVYH
jgi:hypothetical protein